QVPLLYFGRRQRHPRAGRLGRGLDALEDGVEPGRPEQPPSRAWIAADIEMHLRLDLAAAIEADKTAEKGAIEIFAGRQIDRQGQFASLVETLRGELADRRT